MPVRAIPTIMIPSKISIRWNNALESRKEVLLCFLKVYFRMHRTVHQIPMRQKKVPGTAWPLKLPMTSHFPQCQVQLLNSFLPRIYNGSDPTRSYSHFFPHFASFKSDSGWAFVVDVSVLLIPEPHKIKLCVGWDLAPCRIRGGEF